MSLLELNDVVIEYTTANSVMRAVDGVSLRLEKGEFLGLAGESGCGKTTLAMSIPQLLPRAGRLVGGSIDYCRFARADRYQLCQKLP